MRSHWSLVFLLSLASFADAAIEMPPLFRDRMVLQADLPAPVWGKADANTVVSVAFAGQKKTATADKEGHWIVRLDALKPSAEARTLTIQTDGENKVITDVLVGEVWLCSGQSNMFRPLGKIEKMPQRFPGVVGAEEVIGSPPDPLLRLWCDDDHELWEAAGWQIADGKSRRPFSAVAQFFGMRLREELKVPVGLVHVSRGGSAVQAWTPREYALKVPLTKHYHEIQQANRDLIAAYGRARVARAATRPAISPAVETARTFGAFHLYERQIDPLAPFALRGVIWYQGESNASRPDVSQHYDEMFPALVNGWRDRWKQERLPFYFVQLPCWDRGQYWPWTRQGMLNVSRTVPDTGMAVTVDFGDRTNLHPPEKREVGHRLARLALAKSYGRDIVSSGPLVQSLRRDGGTLLVAFDQPLKLKGDAWKDLELAGEDGVFHPATAEVNAAVAIVRSGAVKSPVAVRYGWKAVFEPTLFNAEGLPASPFWYVAAADRIQPPPATQPYASDVPAASPSSPAGPEDVR